MVHWGDEFVTGVNYWPRRKAMYWWGDFDRAEVADEFDLIADLGMKVVRVFLLWDDWQPTPDQVSPECLANLTTVCDLAAERGLGLDVTFFTGHMSGPNWSPRWLLDTSAGFPSPKVRQVVSQEKVVDSSYRNMFHDPEALAAERLLVETVVGALRSHPGVWMWNLGNEPDLFAWPASTQAGAEWVRSMTALIHELDPSHPVTTGLHTASLLENNGLRVDQVFANCDTAVIHGYPMYIPWARDPLDPDFIPFLCALVTALCGKPCLAEEWGGPTAPGGGSNVWEWNSYGEPRQQFMAGEKDLAGYVEAVLPRLVEVGATGSMLWCFADYDPDLWDRPPCDEGGAKHERHFGLVRPDGSLKPHAEVLKTFAASRPVIQPPKKTMTLDIDPDTFYQDPAGHSERLYREFPRS